METAQPSRDTYARAHHEPGPAEPGPAERGPAERGPAEPGPAERGPAEPVRADPGAGEPGARERHPARPASRPPSPARRGTSPPEPASSGPPPPHVPPPQAQPPETSPPGQAGAGPGPEPDVARRRVRGSGPADILAVGPRLLGFHPRLSFVVIGAGGPRQRVDLGFRYDLPDPPGAEAAAEIADHAVAVLAQRGATTGIGIGYGPGRLGTPVAA